MRKLIAILDIAFISLLVLTACAGYQANPIGKATPGSGTPVPTTSSGTSEEVEQPTLTSTPVEPNSEGQLIVTLDDQGKTINMSVGDNFLLKLGEQYTWEVDISDQNVLSRVKNIMVIRGAQGVYDALQPGTVTLSAMGDPQCRQSQPPCEMPSIQFMITVVVK
jgi:hypothetical protein